MRMGSKRGVVALALAVVLGIGATGCSGSAGHGEFDQHKGIELPPLSELTPLDDSTAYEGPTTAVVGGPSIPPFDKAPEPELPVTVTSHDSTGDSEIEVTDASRIVPLSLSGSVGELVHAFGMDDRIVGRDVSTNFPGSEDIPVVTKDGHSVDAEALLALNPSLIITDGSIGPTDVILQMRDAGIPVVTVERAVDAETSYVTTQQVADAMGIGFAAPELIEKMKEAIEQKEAEIADLAPAERPRVAFLYVRGTAGIFYLFGEGSGADSLIESVGAVDAAAEIGWVGEKPMTEEALIAMDPDIILVMTKGLESAGGVDGLLQSQPSIALTTAGEHRRIIDIDDSVVFAGGTRYSDVVDGLARAIYAPDSLAEYQEQ